MKLFDWFFKQNVQEGELDDAFDEAELADERIMNDQGLVGVMVNGDVQEHFPTPDLTIDIVAPVVAYDQEGQRVLIPGTAGIENLDVSVDSNSVSTAVAGGGNEKIVSVFIEFERALSNPRTDGNNNVVQYERDESFNIIVEQGPESAPPATPPALKADALLLGDITRTFGQTQIFDADIDLSRKETTFKLSTASFTIDAGTQEEALQDMLQELQNHVDQVGVAHDADAVGFDAANLPIPGAWSAVAAATEVQAALDGIVDDLGQTAGVPGSELVGFDNSNTPARYPTMAAAGQNQEALDGLTTDLEGLIRSTNIGNVDNGLTSTYARPTDQGTLDADLQASPFWFEGRLYTPTQAQIDSAGGAGGQITFTDNQVNYVGIRPTGGDVSLDEDNLETQISGGPGASFPVGYTPFAVVVTESNDIIQIYGPYDISQGPFVETRVSHNNVILPKFEQGHNGADPGATTLGTKEWSAEWSFIAETVDDDLFTFPLGPYGWHQQDGTPPSLEIPEFPEDIWPVGSIIMFEVDVLGTQISGTATDDVQACAKMIGQSTIILNPNPAVSNSTWVKVFDFLSTQASTQGVSINTVGGSNAGLQRVQVDGGNTTSGTIRWYFHVKMRVIMGRDNDGGSYIVTGGVKLGDVTNFA